MAEKPEDKARRAIDQLLNAAGWVIQDTNEANVAACRGVAIREFPLNSGYGFADYLLYVDGAPAGVVEAKKEGETLTGYEIQTEKYSVGLPYVLKPYRKPLPFCYQSTGIETRFTNLLEPDARSRPVFAFHRPETLADWLMDESRKPGSTLRARLKHMPPLGDTATPGCEKGDTATPGCVPDASNIFGRDPKKSKKPQAGVPVLQPRNNLRPSIAAICRIGTLRAKPFLLRGGFSGLCPKA